MKVLPFKKINAFTAGLAAGNPAGCIYLQNAAELNAVEMQKIAYELKGFVNETAYLFPLADGFRLKFYSAECEVAFCGHGTIAIMYDLIKENATLLKKPEFNIYVNAGKLSVFNHIPTDDAVYIMAPEPQQLPCQLQLAAVAQALALDKACISTDIPLQIIDAGLRTLIVPLTSLAACLSVCPPQENLRQFCIANAFDIILIFCKETVLNSCHYRTRVFAPKYGYLEDPATGSGNSAFGYYLLQQNLWTHNITIEQGNVSANPNIVKLNLQQKSPQSRILFGGSARVQISGNYYLQA